MEIKILVADDSATDRSIIKDMLSGYCVLTACDGVETMRMLEEHDGINLLILDLNMPKMDGFQVLEALKRNERYRKLRTLILTNYDELDNEIKGLRLGAVDYIRKPIHMESLKARIDIHITLLRAEHELELKLNEQTHAFDLIFNQAPIGIAISHSSDPGDTNDKMVQINPVFEQITGRKKDELIRIGWAKITHPDDLEEDLRYYKRLKSGEINMYSMDKRYIRPDGSSVWVHMIVATLNLSSGEIYNHICLVQDISERKAIEKALKESERSKSVLLSHLPGLAYRCNYDRDWTMQYVSEGCFNLTGYPPESLLYNRELSYNDIISPQYREALWAEWAKILETRQPFKYEYEIITATGEKKWVLEMGQGIFNDKGEIEALEGIVLDISERKAIENTLKFNNEHDRWTGLYNRDYLTSLLEKDARLKKDIRRALIGINLSKIHIQTTNYGYQYSQNLIKKAAEALSQLCSDNRILFKPHENSFIYYILDYKDQNELVDFSNEIIKILEALFVTDRIGGGIGILEMDPEETNIELILRRLLIASERSVNVLEKDFDICFYDDELEALVNRERDIVEVLNAIAAADDTNGDLYLQYQPIIDLKKGSVFGFEALARIRNEKLGFVSPLEFIPVAEKTKLILPIGEKVIIKAFNFLSRLKEQGYKDICVTINISAIQLLQPDFTDRLFELMDEMHIDPKSIGIEITESVFISDLGKINNIIDKLRKSGIFISIDDFGIGYSSLARERDLNVDCLKIDKHFIDKLMHIDLSKAITSDIISMSHKLGHFIVAEGVEHKRQLMYLKEHDCDKIQGYLISRPLYDNDALDFLKNYSLNGCSELYE